MNEVIERLVADFKKLKAQGQSSEFLYGYKACIGEAEKIMNEQLIELRKLVEVWDYDIKK